MTAINANSTGVAPGSPAMVAKIESTAEPTSRALQARDKSAQRIGFRPSGTLLSPTAAVPWLLGSLGVVACIAPWRARGWQWLDVIAATVVVVACYDAFALGLRAKNSCPSCCPRKKGFAGARGRASRFRLRSRALGAADCTAKCNSRSWRRREKAKPPSG